MSAADDFVTSVVMEAWELFLAALATEEAKGVPTEDVRASLQNPDAQKLMESVMMFAARVGYEHGRFAQSA